MSFIFNIQTFATTYTTTQTYTTATQTQTTATTIDTDTTLPPMTMEDLVDLVNKEKLGSYAKKITRFYDKRYLRNTEVTFITDEDIDGIIDGLEDEEESASDTVVSGDGDGTVESGEP